MAGESSFDIVRGPDDGEHAGAAEEGGDEPGGEVAEGQDEQGEVDAEDEEEEGEGPGEGGDEGAVQQGRMIGKGEQALDENAADDVSEDEGKGEDEKAGEELTDGVAEGVGTENGDGEGGDLLAGGGLKGILDVIDGLIDGVLDGDRPIGGGLGNGGGFLRLLRKEGQDEVGGAKTCHRKKKNPLHRGTLASGAGGANLGGDAD